MNRDLCWVRGRVDIWPIKSPSACVGCVCRVLGSVGRVLAECWQRDKTQLYESPDQQSSDQVRPPPSARLRHDNLLERHHGRRRQVDNSTFGLDCTFRLNICTSNAMNCAKNNCALIVAVKKKDCQLSCPCELNFALRHSNAMPNWQKHCFQMNSYVWLALDRIRGFLCAASSPIFLSGSPQFSSEISNPRNVPSCNWIFSQLERSGGIARTKIDKSEAQAQCWQMLSLKKMSQIRIVHKSCKSWKIILSVGKMEESEPDLKLKWNILDRESDSDFEMQISDKKYGWVWIRAVDACRGLWWWLPTSGALHSRNYR